MTLPTEIIEQIVLFSKSFKVAHTLKDYISKYVYDKCERNILVYGQVQSGKTKEIIKIIKSDEYKDIIKVLVVQNSLLVLKQYHERLCKEDVDYQIITKASQEINKKVVLVMSNTYRYSYFQKIEPNKYVLILDESDQTWLNCPLEAYKTFHVTATPFKKLLYDKIICTDVQNDYYGIKDLNVVVEDDNDKVINEFLSTSNGMMLINKYMYISDMKYNVDILSKRYPKIPIVLLTSEKRLYLNNKSKILKERGISAIIDSLKKYNHIIFIANRLSNRGLSYVSSDYSRHLTYQITKVKDNITTFLQSLRILGIYKDNPDLKLIIGSDDEKKFYKYIKYIDNFNVNSMTSLEE